jgi:hypothetical protein
MRFDRWRPTLRRVRARPTRLVWPYLYLCDLYTAGAAARTIKRKSHFVKEARYINLDPQSRNETVAGFHRNPNKSSTSAQGQSVTVNALSWADVGFWRRDQDT